MTVALALPTTWLDDDTRALAIALENQLASYQASNQLKASYYDGQQRLKDLNIAIPPSLRSMSVVIGWPATVVDVLEERLDLRGWEDAGAGLDLAGMFDANRLDVEASWAHLDALIYGISFVAVSTGLAGEPDPLITPQSPTNMTATIDVRSRHVDNALNVETDDTGMVIAATLYLPDETLWLSRVSGAWQIENRDPHHLGRVPIVPLVNRPRIGDMAGRSEITPTVRYLTDNAMRTLAASEVGREFFASPQRYVLGAPESFFLDDEGKPRPAWESYLGRILAIERDEADQIPTVGEFRGTSLGPYFEQIKSLATLLAAESSIPSHYLGWVTDNPTSADAIRQGEARLVKRVERRQKQFGHAWCDVAELALMFRDGSASAPAGLDVEADWVNAATPTKAADADRIQKLIAAKVLRPDSRVTWQELGFTPEQMRILELENAAATEQPPAPADEPPRTQPAPAIVVEAPA